MIHALCISSAAERDIEDARLWYERQRAGLGVDFVLSVDDAMARILVNPTSYPQIHRNYRRALVRRFPFGIFFRMEDTVIAVSAVFHTQRSPATWDSRLSTH